jgi:hypothetical protein
VLVPDVAPEGCAFAADFTFGSHSLRRVTEASGLVQLDERRSEGVTRGRKVSRPHTGRVASHESLARMLAFYG